jgi:hypothetical protein
MRCFITGILLASAIFSIAPQACAAKSKFGPSAFRRPTSYFRTGMAKLFLDKGSLLLRSGNVTTARSLYIYCAFRGHAECAEGAGDSYNPLILRTISNPNGKPNEERARWWYGFAASLERRDSKMASRPRSRRHGIAKLHKKLHILGMSQSRWLPEAALPSLRRRWAGMTIAPGTLTSLSKRSSRCDCITAPAASGGVIVAEVRNRQTAHSNQRFYDLRLAG